MTCLCGPQIHEITSTGGVRCGGSASVYSTSERTSGGIRAGGSASVSIPTHVFDGYHTVLHLQESGDGTEGEFINSTGLSGGTGGAGVNQPTQLDGLWTKANLFDANDYIRLPADNIPNTSAFTISLWARRKAKFLERIFYSRGSSDPTNGKGWSLAIGHTFGNKALARVQVVGSTNWIKYQTTGTTDLEEDCWYHIAAVWTPGVSLKLFVDGVQEGSRSVTESTLVASNLNSHIGRQDNHSFTAGDIQEVRLIAEAKTSTWLAAETATMCSLGHYLVV